MEEKTPFCATRRILWAALPVFCLTACVQAEFDKMAGTQFPPAQTVGGEEVTITTIYRDVGFPVFVDQHEAGITPLAGDCISEAELDSLETGHRDVPLGPSAVEDCPGCTAFNVYAVTVAHFLGDDVGPCEPDGTSGMVWTDQRRSLALFYPTSISTNASFHLLAATHELGHTFGLHHADGNQSYTDATIMNDGSYFSGNNWVFEFTAQSREHLEDHPVVCKAPGERSFWAITPEHKLWSEDELFDHGFFNLSEDEVCP
jgi:hypothetical protein